MDQLTVDAATLQTIQSRLKATGDRYIYELADIKAVRRLLDLMVAGNNDYQEDRERIRMWLVKMDNYHPE